MTLSKRMLAVLAAALVVPVLAVTFNPSFAKGRVTKLGRRSANLTVEAWQDDRSRPIATAVMNVLMAEPEG